MEMHYKNPCLCSPSDADAWLVYSRFEQFVSCDLQAESVGFIENQLCSKPVQVHYPSFS